MTDLLGTDLAFGDDLQISATGDLDTIDGIENVKGAIIRRIMTIPGTLIHRPDYGCGLIAFQNAPLSLNTKRQLSTRIAEQLPLDTRVEKVNYVSITSRDSDPSTLTIKISVEVVGVGAEEFTFTPFNSEVA